MSFDQVLGQDLAVTILQNSLRQDRLHHAYLFTGEEGVGKDKAALEFAKAVNCKEEVDDACGECISCRKAESGNHPDLKKVKPDGASIKIDQIRDLQKEIIYKPYESRKKVYIIYQVEKMTTEAANSLLKTLEDPPEYGILILLTSNLNQLLPTVVSRCELVRFKRASDDSVRRKLKTDYQLSPEKEELITSLAFGKIRRAVELAEEAEELNWRQEIIDIILSLSDLNRLKVFTTVQKIIEFKDNINQVLAIFLTWYRDILLCKLNSEEDIVNADYRERLIEESAALSTDQIEQIIDLIAETNNKIRNVNVNLQLTLEVMLLRVNKIRRKNR